MINQWIPDAEVFDMFAGSGAMGLEALSRGAERCVFCEASRANFKVLLSNISGCNAGERSEAINKDYKAAITSLAGKNTKFDVVIMDPPYDQIEYYGTAMEMLQDNELIDEGSIVICEHLYDNKLSDTYGKLEKIKDKKYGSIGVSVYFYNEI